MGVFYSHSRKRRRAKENPEVKVHSHFLMWVGKMNEKRSSLNTYSTIEVLLQKLLKVMLSFDSTLGCET